MLMGGHMKQDYQAVGDRGGEGLAALVPVLLSVVIPVYGTKLELLERCVRSFEFIWDRCEFVIVDDGSPASYVRCLRVFVERVVPKAILVERPHSGPNGARQAGLDVCRGTYVWFCDGDDQANGEALPGVLSCLERYAPKVLSINYEYSEFVDGRSVFWGGVLDWPTAYRKANIGDMVLTSGALWRNIYNREILIQLGYGLIQGTCIGEDVDTSLAFFVGIGECSTIGINAYRYCMSSGSLTANLPDDSWMDPVKGFDQALKAMGPRCERFHDEVEWVAIRNILFEGGMRLAQLCNAGASDYMRKYYAFMDEHFPRWQINRYLVRYLSGELRFLLMGHPECNQLIARRRWWVVRIWLRAKGHLTSVLAGSAGDSGDD